MVRVLLSILGLLSPALCLAQNPGGANYSLTVGGTTSSVMTIITGFSELLVRGMLPVTIAVVTIGGLMLAAAHGNESWAENGKKAVIGGLIGFAIVMSSYAILRMLFGFIYL